MPLFDTPALGSTLLLLPWILWVMWTLKPRFGSETEKTAALWHRVFGYNVTNVSEVKWDGSLSAWHFPSIHKDIKQQIHTSRSPRRVFRPRPKWAPLLLWHKLVPRKVTRVQKRSRKSSRLPFTSEIQKRLQWNTILLFRCLILVISTGISQYSNYRSMKWHF